MYKEGGVKKKEMNPVIFYTKNPLNGKNCILLKAYIQNFKSITQKQSDLQYLKVDPKFGTEFWRSVAPHHAMRKIFPPTVSAIITYTNGGSQVS